MERQIFRSQERLLVEEKYRDLLAYELMAAACEETMRKVEGLRLHPSELFYHCFVVIDRLRGIDREKRQWYCDLRLRNELAAWFYDCGFGEGEDVERCVCAIVQGAMVLAACGCGLLSSLDTTRVCAQMYRSSPYVFGDVERTFRSAVTPMWWRLEEAMKEYCRSDASYAADINELLEEAAAPCGDIPEPAVFTVGSSVRIADKKKTSVLVVLNAMFKAGWFVDKDGGELKNRDSTLNEILHLAFGVDRPTAISQTINPSKNIKGNEKNVRLMDKLLDEEGMMEYVKEIQKELREVYLEEMKREGTLK